MSDLINFVCVRVQAELNLFEKTSTIPHTLLDGVFTVDDIIDCRQYLSPRYQDLADKLVNEYTTMTEKSIESMRRSLKQEYNAIFQNAYTKSNNFWFPAIAVNTELTSILLEHCTMRYAQW